MTQDIMIRAFEPEDIVGLTELLNQPTAVWGTLQRPYMSIAKRLKLLEKWDPELSLVAVIEGRLAGQISLQRFEHRRSHACGLGMVVHEDFAGRGCGTALMEAALDYADRWLSVWRIELNVYTDNDRAIRLYKRHGFEEEGVFRGYAYRDGQYVDSMAMARLTGPLA